MVEHASIHLTAEYVHARFADDGVEVECIFFLENRGPATVVTIGFPNQSMGADIEHIVPFRRFESYVDGDSVGVTVLPDAKHQSYGDYRCWYTKEVSFSAGQRRCIRDVYTADTGMSVPNTSWFEYILWSGSSWAGPIEVADIVFDVGSPEALPDSADVSPGGFHVSGSEIRWHFTDLEPDRRSDTGVIHVSWD